MWKDADIKIQELLSELEKGERSPMVCPVCEKREAHVYMHIHNDKTRMGGLWIWCSDCRSFLHGSVCVPGYWKNCPVIQPEKLTALPEYLETLKDNIDAHTNTIITDHKYDNKDQTI